ncbi:nucleotidyltransferase family protein [Enterovibrio calviensis]|uniref:nucleotidyltransferase family protein n=1 Tax=Enterovibrio calviensis TaxID=91359 RepID=UPI00048512C3|nr:nucleotidyltransferase family protein [Enterovibrio calviensis]
MDRIVQLVKQDPMRMKALDCVFQLGLPQSYLAAGFVRNLVWDYLHDKPDPTPLNDLDVIYFDPTETRWDAYLEYEERLNSMMPELNWQVRNQAAMHERNGDPAYVSSVDAMRYWPEKETAVGIRILGDNQYECVSAFGFESLFALHVTHNPKRERAVFEQRMNSKGWLTHWPKLKVVMPAD